MAVEIQAIIERMIRDNAFRNIINNPAAQFGTVNRALLGASILPERNVDQLSYDESGIRYRTVMANDGTRYSPVQKKKGVLTGSFHVQLGHQDIGSSFDASEYDALLRLLRDSTGVSDNYSMQAMTNLVNWAERTLSQPLREVIEKQRWQAIVGASVVREGDNGYTETVTLSNPSGHRIAAGSTWSNDANDPYVDIMDMVDFLAGKGYKVSRIIGSTPVVTIIASNAKMRQRLGWISVASGSVTGLAGRAQLSDINQYLAGDGVPPIEKYDLQYAKDEGTDYFLDRDVLVFLCETARDTSIDLGDAEPVVLPNTLGYVGVGPAAGQLNPGRVVYVNPKLQTKPPSIEGEAWQASFPVITIPEAIGVINTIA